MPTREYVLRVRLNLEEQRALEAFAEAKGISAAEAVRDWIKSLMAKRMKEK